MPIMTDKELREARELQRYTENRDSDSSYYNYDDNDDEIEF